MFIVFLIIAMILFIIVINTVSSQGEKDQNDHNEIKNYKEYFSMETSQEILEYPEPEYYVPNADGEEELKLIVKNTEWVYAYWNLPQFSSIEKPILRIYNLTKTNSMKTSTFHDIPISNEVADWHIHIAKPLNKFVAQMGFYSDTDFSALITSNEITLPANALSEEFDPSWTPLNSAWNEEILKMSNASSDSLIKGNE